ncbi:MAG: glycosyltransferase family 39 protein, partial [Pseudobdellovibrionaceae bacterium]|nr:glycosyltransferase family 39 protein [Pseudobdellovibrionaceae bacterium]
MSAALPRTAFIILLVALALTRLINAIWLPPAQDEAYYFLWSRFLDGGYFDHPPLVAFLSAAGNLVPGSALFSRLGTFLLSLLSLPVLFSLFRRMGLKDSTRLGQALILASCSAAAVIQGYITTPDIPMIFCWILALHEAAAALDDNPKRWLSAGFFTGLGFMGKYTMALIGPVFLIGLLARPRHLTKVWPYLGGVVCVLTMLPHLLWLNQNDWITLRFQFGRGLMSVYTVDMQSGTDLPRAVDAPKDGIETRLANYFKLPDDEIKKPKPPKPLWLKRVNNFLGYIGGQIGLWGLLLVPLLIAMIKRQQVPTTWQKPELKALAWAAFIVPVGLFALLSPFQFIEANWPAMYLVGAAIVITQSYRLSPKVMIGAAAANMVLTLLLTLHNHQPLPGTQPHKDRLLKETHGYRELSALLQALPAPVFMDTYQNASQLAFHAPALKIQQWPGIARTSELIRREAMN